MGVHAGGLIIAKSPLHELVPLVKRKDNPSSQCVGGGLHGQDLGPMGLVKFDLLVINNLLQIAKACQLIKRRHGLQGIANAPGQGDFTDVERWRNDAKALEMADRGDLKCIFQFDSEGIRALARSGGVTRFEDLVAYTALYRPGPLGMQMDKRYVERKRGREPFVLHPLLHPILHSTYGVLTYQEQIMRILNIVGEIPLKDCELVPQSH
jgi:DNA polymerase-3 subunit alpha